MKTPIPRYSFPAGTAQRAREINNRYDRIQLAIGLIVVALMAGYFLWQFFGR